MVRMDTEDAAFDPRTVWKGALRRFETKAKALCEKVQIQVRRAISRGKETPKAEGRGAPLAPLARLTISEGGQVDLVWDDELIKKINELAGKAEQ